MKTYTNIENPTLNDIKVELYKMFKDDEYETNYGDVEYIEMTIKFADGSIMKLTPTFWSPFGFTGFHYTFSDEEYWLDTEHDEGSITADMSVCDTWLNATASRIYDEMVFRGGSFASVNVSIEEIEA